MECGPDGVRGVKFSYISPGTHTPDTSRITRGTVDGTARRHGCRVTKFQPESFPVEDLSATPVHVCVMRWTFSMEAA
jgi:hypothetical protein